VEKIQEKGERREMELSDGIMTFMERHLKWPVAAQRYKAGA
jgi:hypothetical protein